MRTIILVGLCSVSIFLHECKVEPQPIPYGKVGCAFCQMTVVKPQFAAELVSTTGKVYYFDAIECMVQYIDANPQSKWSFQLVNDYFNPQDQMDATRATFLISEAIPSPMGAYLSASTDPLKWESTLQGNAGQLYTWEELKTRLIR